MADNPSSKPDPFSKVSADLIPTSKAVELCSARARELFDRFRAAQKEAAEAKKQELADFYELLAQAFSMGYRPDKPTDPFVPLFSGPGGRTAITSDFSDKNLEIFQAMIGQPIGAGAKARLADIIWLRKRDRAAAEVAVTAYLDQAEAELKPGTHEWTEGRESLERAAQLWRALGSPAPLQTRIIEIPKKYAALEGAEPKDFYRVQIVRLVAEYGLHDDIKPWLDACDKFARECQQAGDFDKARAYCEIGVTLAKRAKDGAKAAELADREVMSYVEEARKLKATGAAGLLLGHRYNQAIEACRRAGGKRALIDELHKELNEVQQKAVDEMKEVSFTHDASEIVKAGRDAIGAHSKDQILRNFAAMAKPPKVADLRQTAIENSQKFVAHALFSSIIVNEKGRIVGRRGATLSSDENEREAALVDSMIQDCSLHQSVACIQIEVARQEFLLRDPIDPKLFDGLLEMNPFVPDDRKDIFRKGLLAGLEGDRLTCAHLLIPQVENSFRNICELAGIIVTHLDSDQIQNELDLNTLLYREDVQKVWGSDLVFTLRVLLTEHTGRNLRNRLAHGLLSQDSFGPDPMDYLWALTIRILIQVLASTQTGATTSARKE